MKKLLTILLVMFNCILIIPQQYYKVQLNTLYLNGIPFNLALNQIPEYLNYNDNLTINGRVIDENNNPIAFVDVGIEDGLKLQSIAVTTNSLGEFSYQTFVNSENIKGPRNLLFFTPNSTVYTHLNFSINVPPNNNLFSNAYLTTIIPDLNSNYSFQINQLTTTDENGIPYWIDKNYVSSIYTIQSEDDVTEENYVFILQQYQLTQTNPYFNNPGILTKAKQIDYQRRKDMIRQILGDHPGKIVAYVGSGGLCASTLVGNPIGPEQCAEVASLLAEDILELFATFILEKSGAPQNWIDAVNDAGTAIAVLHPSWGLAGNFIDEAVMEYYQETNFDIIEKGHQGYLTGIDPFQNYSFAELDDAIYIEFENNGELFTVGIKPNQLPQAAQNSLYLGYVNPTSGSTLDDFNFSVTYKSTGNLPPDNVQLHILNQFTDNMTASGSNWQQGVEFTKSLNNFAVGQYQFYFSATVNGQTLRYPDTGYLNFNVTQNVSGWDLRVSSLTYTPTIVTPGSNFSATGSIHNNSNSPDKIYNNVNYSFTFYDQSGNVIGTPQTGTVSQIIQGQTIPITNSFTAPSNQGNCQLVFSVYPQLDGVTSNNTLSKTIIVSSTGPQKQWLVTSSNATVQMNSGYPTHSFNGHTYTLTLANNTSISIKRDDYTSPHSINFFRLRTYDDGLVAVVNEFCSTGEAYVSFGLDNPNYVTYDQTNITISPGTTIEFVAHCSAAQFSATDADIYRNNDGLTIEPWYDSFTRFDGNYSVKYVFDIPTSATTGSYSFYMAARLSNNNRFVRELQITVIAAPPSITSINSNNFSADDEITITGTGFGSTGTVKFNELAAIEIVSWATTQIKAKVPVGVQSGNLIVINANGPSNGIAYAVKSSTGAPEVIAPIPDQSIYQDETRLIASLNNVFSEPNNQVMTFSATSSNPDVLIDQNLLTTGQLSLNALSSAIGNSTITVTATDPNNKTASDEFLITIIPTQQSFITLTSPNGGEDWTIGSPQNITWVSNGTSGNVKIEITRDGGNNWEVLFDNTADDETENWIVTGPTTNNSKIRIGDISGTPSDISDNTFNINTQNVPPTLTWTGESGYEADGVDPDEGNTTSEFTFKVNYSDADGDAPLTEYPKIHIKKGGVEITNSPFAMTEVVLDEPQGSKKDGAAEKIEMMKEEKGDSEILSESPMGDGYPEGVIYEYSKGGLEAGTDYTYYFEAYDANNNLATGEAIVEQSGPIVNGFFFSKITISLPYEGIVDAKIIWGDYDNDSDLDFVIMGLGFNGAETRLYKNENNDNFSIVSTSLESLNAGDLAWGDYDNDNDLDLFLCGRDINGNDFAALYKNEGNNQFTKLTDSFQPASASACEWVDIDNDGDLDLTYWGGNIENGIAYLNNGLESFEEINLNLVGMSNGDIAWGDYDTDGDMDLLISGYMSDYIRIYRNDGNLSFTDINIDFAPMVCRSVKWGDYDSDGDLDVLIVGGDYGGTRATRVYKNLGNDTFNDINAGFTDLNQGDGCWGDLDNDGDLDIVTSGDTGNGNQTFFYFNTGNDLFLEVSDPLVTTYQYLVTGMALADYNNDNSLDILHSNGNEINIYKNIHTASNSPPSPLTTLNYQLQNKLVTLQWNDGSDNSTDINSLSYNFYLSTVQGSVNIVSPMSDLTSGRRMISSLGNANLNNEISIGNLNSGTYYWSVQAIDNSFLGSQFADEQSFVVFAQPTLSWAGEPGYENDGINPQEGEPETSFSFKVTYASVDGFAPQSDYPKVHIKKGGIEISGSPFPMQEVVANSPMNNPIHTNKEKKSKDIDNEIKNREGEFKGGQGLDDFLEGVIYEYPISGLEVGNDYTYYFEAYAYQ